MDSTGRSALSILHEVARRAGRIDEVVTRNDTPDRHESSARGEPNNMLRKPIGKIITNQAHQIQSTTLRSSANDFFGVDGGSEAADQGRTSPVTITTTISPKARTQLLHFLDPLVLMFNAADFDALAASLAAACSKDVAVHTKLVPDGVVAEQSNVKPFCPGSPPPEFLHTRGLSAVLLFWMLLHEAHPDGVMQIIDKRICYRKVLPERILTPRAITSAASRLSLVENQEKACLPSQGCSTSQSRASGCDGRKTATCGSSGASSGPTITDIGNNNTSNSSNNKNNPVSIVEIVLKLSGACITTHSLHDLFCDLTSDNVPQLIAVPARKDSLDSDGEDKVSYDTDAFSSYISTCLTKEHCCAACMAARAAEPCCPAPKKPKCDPDVSTVEAVPPPPPPPSRSPGFLHEHSRRYLLELRVVFDQYDAITDWTATVMAAETS